MSVQDFIFRIGADVSEFEKSITEVEAELNRWKNTLKTASKEGIVEANRNIVALTDTIDRLKKQGLDKLPGASQKGAAALNSVGQVARDLPFGFIAIQNNLPIVIDQFGELIKSSNGIGGALKSIGSALIGPAGLTFAFGASIAVITSLIQKYGSLSNAITVLTTKNKFAAEAQLTYNKSFLEAGKSIGSEIAQINILVKTISDTRASREEQLAAYNKLKEIAPDVIRNLSAENALTDQGRRLIAAQAQTRIELLNLKVKERGINAVLDDLYQKELVANGKLVAAKKDLARATKAESDLTAKAAKDQERYDGELSNASNEVSIYEERVKEARAELNQIKQTQTNWTSSLEQSLSRINAIEKEVKDANDAYKAQEDLLKRLERQSIKTANQEQQDQDAVERQVRESNNRIANFKAKQLEKQAADNRAKGKKEAEKTAKEELAAYEKLAASQTGLGIFVDPKLNETFDKVAKETNLASGIRLIEDTFFSPLQNAFTNLLTNTEFTFKEFGNIIKQAIARLVSQIIATGIIQLIATILSGGFAAIPGGGGFAKGISTVFQKTIGSLGFIAPQKIANPSFSNVNGGNLGLTGAVNLTLRGSDLVGAMNRTNTTITRVG